MTRAASPPARRDRRGATLAGEGEVAWLCANAGSRRLLPRRLRRGGPSPRWRRHLPQPRARRAHRAARRRVGAGPRRASAASAAFLDLVASFGERAGPRRPGRAGGAAGGDRGAALDGRRRAIRLPALRREAPRPGAGGPAAGTRRQARPIPSGCGAPRSSGRSGSWRAIRPWCRRRRCGSIASSRGDATALEPNLHDAAVGMAARAGGRRRFDALRARFPVEPDPAFQRRYLVGLALFEDPALASRARGHGVRERGAAAGPVARSSPGCSRTGSARDPFWHRLRDELGGDREAASSARPCCCDASSRRSGSSRRGVTSRRPSAFFAAHPIAAARQAMAQTLERMRAGRGAVGARPAVPPGSG